jgi:hypothetical protein
MATRRKNRHRAQLARQKSRPNRPEDRRQMRKILWQLLWVGFGLGGVYYFLRDPQNWQNWIGIVAWLAISMAWFLHVTLRWIFDYFQHRKPRT